MAVSLPCCGSSAVLIPPPLAPRHRPTKPSLFLPPSTEDQTTAIARISRRSSFLLPFPFLLSASTASASPPALELYINRTEGFTLLKPSSWIQVEKAGATVLFEEQKGSNNIGVVVNPVRLSSLKDFGTPEFVADKLIQAERRKESTKDAELISVNERLGHSGLPIYEFEYLVDSTRGGMKRIFSAAFVASRKLYLLNIAYSDRSENPLDNETRVTLEQIIHSFDTV
ncbi:psbP domain-containing protein 2, chloroplastic [Canna indica]|uniref:PsbP domain-containing protein 2, chloroplastic n=1 Tax=Canna indica TaxID=4628 RepID=A0AAQ3KU78_9LILI|nr:psbP domain-containing protein 2, chloroplastic [Canna indica]